jgi:pimeloyl-ACP methyl ester carboxylesterase
MDLDAFTSHYHLRDTRSGQLAYVDIGSGPPVLFVHGVCVNSALWRRVIAAVQHEYRCLAVDLPLHGRSPARSDHNYSLATLAQALGDLLDDLDVPVVHLIGNDTGGAVCQVFAATQHERLRSLTLTNCDTRDNIPPEPFVRTVELARQGRLAKAATRWVHNLNLARSERSIGSGYRNRAYLTDAAIRHYLGPVLGTLEVAKEFEHFLSTALRADDLITTEPMLSELDVPTLIVWAANDIFFDRQWADQLAQLIPGASQPIIVPDAALYFADEQPETLVPHLLSHWGQDASPNTTFFPNR